MKLGDQAVMCQCRCEEQDKLKVRDVLYGFCNGRFGRDSYSDKTVEAIGTDWVVVRYESGELGLYQGDPSVLRRYRSHPDEYGRYGS